MKSEILFHDKSGVEVTNTDILKILDEVKAYDAEVLYIHSSLSFGALPPGITRSAILQAIYEVLLETGVQTICMPTFTFSFCNGKNYDPLTSRSRMGALNEFFRVQDGVLRSNDPLMSVALIGKDKELITGIGTESVGKDSTFDLLHRRNKVKFLFLGTKIGDCFTYMHFLEWLFKVDYRYNRTFTGTVIYDLKEIQKAYLLFVRYNGVTPNNGSYIYEQKMYDTGLAIQKRIGDSTISIVDEKAATDCYQGFLHENPYFFVDISPHFSEKDKTFIMEKEMVAL